MSGSNGTTGGQGMMPMEYIQGYTVTIVMMTQTNTLTEKINTLTLDMQGNH